MMIFTTAADASINHLVSFVLPTSIPRDQLCGACLHIDEAFEDLPWDYEVVLVDDRQSQVANAAFRQLNEASHSRFRLEEFDRPLSRQQALMAGVIAVKGKVIVLLDEVPHDFGQQLQWLLDSLDRAYETPATSVAVASEHDSEYELAEMYRDRWSQVA